jgi:hypothetical protein
LFVVALFFIGTELQRATLEKFRGRAMVFAVGLWMVVVCATLAAVLTLV